MASLRKREIRVIAAAIILLAVLYFVNRGLGAQSPRQELMEYLADNIDYSSIAGPNMPVGTNFYPDNYHGSSEYPQGTDLSQYFKTSNSENEIDQLSNIDNNTQFNSAIKKQRVNRNRDIMTDQPLTLDIGGSGGKVYETTMWNYEAENVMNGGNFMGGITGADTDQSGFGAYLDDAAAM